MHEQSNILTRIVPGLRAEPLLYVLRHPCPPKILNSLHSIIHLYLINIGQNKQVLQLALEPD